jgi:hypothetical protein
MHPLVNGASAIQRLTKAVRMFDLLFTSDTDTTERHYVGHARVPEAEFGAGAPSR